MLRDRWGLTLLELLVTILIIVIIISLLLPVFRSARYRAKDTVCISNMRQILSAIAMYRADYHNEFPKKLNLTLPYTNTLTIYHCPVDQQGGISVIQEVEGIPKLSYGYFEYFTESNFIEVASGLDPNHGILVCVWHPMSNLEYASLHRTAPFLAPFVRRGLVDGSVRTVRKRSPSPDELDPNDRNNPGGNGCFNGWILFTDAPCPAAYCQNPDCLDG